MRNLFAAFAIILAAAVCPLRGQIIPRPNWPAGTAVPGPRTTGPGAGYFNDFFTNVGVSSGNVGSPTGSSNGTADNSLATGSHHPGVWQQSSGTVSGAGVYVVIASNRPFTGMNAGQWYWERDVQIPVLPGTTAGSYEEGISNQAFIAPPWTNNVGAFYLSSANANPNHWYCVIGATTTDSGVTATTNWARLGILADGTNLHFYINGVEATACAGAQSGAYSFNAYAGSVTVAGSITSVTKYIDYDSFYQSNPGR